MATGRHVCDWQERLLVWQFGQGDDGWGAEGVGVFRFVGVV